MTDAVKSVCEQWISAGYGEDCFWENWPDCPCEDSLTPNQVIAAVTKLENENQRLREALRPFGEATDHAIKTVGKTTTLSVLGALATYFVSWRDFKRARAALRSTEDNGK